MARRDSEFGGFTSPKVTPRHYIAQGPSVWAETFDREAADAELARFLGDAPVERMVDLFLDKRATAEDKGVNWATVVGFLARMTGVFPRDVPAVAAVAFWGQYLIALQEKGTN